MKGLLAYIPVLHQGYIRLLDDFRAETVRTFVLGQDLITELMPLHAEIRGLDPYLVQQALEGLDMGPIEVVHSSTIQHLERWELVAPDEDVTRLFAERYLAGNPVRFESIWLRWDSANVMSQTDVKSDRISTEQFDRDMIALAETEASASSDWWRQVGAVVVGGRRVKLKAHNFHVPSPHSPYADGDPRDVIPAGTLSELNTALHSEQAIIAEAARQGIALEGRDLYVTVFPCPMCAKQVAQVGFRRLFFGGGHASLDGEKVLRARGVEIIAVR